MTRQIIQTSTTRNIPYDRLRWSVVLYYGALFGCLLHTAFVAIFAVLDVWPLSYLNIVSTLIYLVSLVSTLRGFHSFAALLLLDEVAIHAAVAVFLLGWSSGFQHYLLVAVPFISFNHGWSRKFRLLILANLLILYLALLSLSEAVPPLFPIEPGTLRVMYTGNVLALFTILAGLAYYYSSATQQVEMQLLQSNSMLEVLATYDDLTQLINRRNMMRRIEEEVSRVQRGGRPFVLILADIDDFKAFNDRYGHECGDFILVNLAAILKESLRTGDLVSRWGGEEFLLLLPNTGLDGGAQAAQKLCDTVADVAFTYKGRQLSITMTFGVSVYIPGKTIEQTLRESDRNLLYGKNTGKNRVVLHQFDLEVSPFSDLWRVRDHAIPKD